MKKLFGVICALVCVAGVVRADSVTFKETYREGTGRFCEPELGCNYFETVNGSFSGSGSITLPGLSAVRLDEIAGGEGSLGGASYSFSLGDPGVTPSANRLIVKLGVEGEDDNGDPVFVSYGNITFTRNGNVLSFTFTVSNPPGISIAAAQYAEPADPDGPATQPVSSAVEFHLRLGEFDFTRRVYYKGTASYRNGTLGTGEDAEPVTLATVSISGAADYTKPTLSITLPKPNQRISNEVFLVTGKAADNGVLAEIRVRVNNGEFGSVELPVEGSAWTNSVILAPGTNTIEAFSIDADTNVSAIVKVKCFYVLTNALTLIYSEGNTVMGVSNGQVLEVGRGYKATAKPGATNLFSYWSNSVSGLTFSNAILPFQMEVDLVLEAHFIPNPWLPNAGTYNGLFLPVAFVSPTNAGFITLQLTDKGKVTGKITQGTKTRGFMGQVALDGSALIRITTAPALTLQLLFDLANGTVDGSVSNAAWQSALHAERQAPEPALVGKHTFAIPGAPAEESTNRPAGDGAGVLTIKADGSAALAGNLGEGAPLTAGSGISRGGGLPVHAVQFGGQGLFIGWLNVSTSAAPLTVTGASLTWLKPPGLASQKTYPAGFHEPNKSLLGARYTPPPRGTNGLSWTNGVVLLDGGRLTSTISNALTVAGTKLAAPGNTNKIVLTLTASSGKLSGSFLHPVSSRSTPLNGYVLQRPEGDVGRGWFISTNESGFLDLHPLVP